MVEILIFNTYFLTKKVSLYLYLLVHSNNIIEIYNINIGINFVIFFKILRIKVILDK